MAFETANHRQYVIMGKTILFASYGGGHAESLIPVYKALSKIHGLHMVYLAFTVAYENVSSRVDSEVISYSYLKRHLPKNWVLPDAFNIPSERHPLISKEDHEAYYTIGIYDLISEFGEQNALKLYSSKGRVAFCPVLTMTKFLEEMKPDIVITTASPRSELAVVRSAFCLDIPSIVVSDLFLTTESSYIGNPAYASDITVISESVARFLRSEKGMASTIHVTGNPAFDNIYKEVYAKAGGDLRRGLGLSEDNVLITWFGPPGLVRSKGRKLIQTIDVLKELKKLKKKYPQVSIVVRPHPNSDDVGSIENADYVVLGRNYPVEAVILASDITICEVSTAAYQAHLAEKLSVVIGCEDDPPFAKFKVAERIHSVADLSDILPTFFKKISRNPSGLANNRKLAVENVVNVILEKLDMV